jgi:serine/threonine protein kinase
VGTVAWASPEQLAGETCSTASDIWSFGTILWELCTGERPTQRCLAPIAVPEQAPAAVAALVERCHRVDPAMRPDIGEVYRMLFACAQLDS